MNAVASIGSLVQPNPVENSIVLPASPNACCRINIYRPSAKTMRHSARKMLTHRCEIVALKFKRRTNGPRERRAPDDELLARRHPAGLEARTSRPASSSVPNGGARWRPPWSAMIVIALQVVVCA
ncbi:hypothetical protein WI560_27730 [Bradyrhizobium sp. A11]|uniref:hypothetical protein n=1 Tax=Bradyrhizobium sp. A11 TaxID=3133974 RepID=UPI003250EAD0